MYQRKTDWRADFRLHAMDMDSKPEAAGAETHWMLGKKGLLDMLAMLEKDALHLCSMGGDPGYETKPEAILAHLGYRDLPEPHGFFASGKFMAGFTLACFKETSCLFSAMEALRAAARPGRSRTMRN